MSEPVTNSDIEDVLSSIRRLISENPGEEAAHDTPAPAAQTPDRDKLVLTPAFRVPDADAPPADARKSDTKKPEAPTPSQAGGAAAADTLEGRIAELEAAIGNAPDEWEPDGSEAQDQASGLVFLKGAPEADAARTNSAQASEAEFVDMVDDAAASSAEVLNYSAAGLVLEAEEIPDDDEAAHDPDHGGQGSQDGAQDEDHEDANEATASAAPSPDEIVIDEDALRELVSQLVRSELKGRIGQRITRNIRRMVRREIKLALSLRDMD